MSQTVATADEARAEYRAKVTALNDAFRKTFSGGKVFLTAGVSALPIDVCALALLKVALFKDFDEDNDPWGEHDFGAFKLEERTFFWKIDYYDKAMKFGSEDRADPEKTTRVLTLMLADEY